MNTDLHPMIYKARILTVTGSLGVIIGFFRGALIATRAALENRYLTYGMTWLFGKLLAYEIGEAILRGAAVGLGVGLLIVAMRMLFGAHLVFQVGSSADASLATRLRRWVGALAVALLIVTLGLFLVLATAAPRPRADARRIFLLTVDTLRADHLGCYGYGRETSPKLDRLSEEGRLYSSAFSHAPSTGSSTSCILTGYRPRETGTYRNDPIRPSMNTVAEYLRNAGYRTGAVVSNYVLHRYKNYEIGFDDYDDRMDDQELVRRSPERIGEKTTAAALAWLRRNGDRPFFLWVHYQDPHGPYTPPKTHQALFLGDRTSHGQELRVCDGVGGQGGIPSYQVLDGHRRSDYYVSQYDAEIRYVDDSLHQLVSGIKEMGLWKDALVIFSADHGEGMGEHDYYFAHGDYLYPGQLHVPLILWGPADRVTPGLDPTLVQLSDITPTLLAFAGLRPATALPGRDLLGAGLKDAEVLSETLTTDNYKCSLLARDLEVVYDRLNDDYRPYDWRRGTFLSGAAVPHEYDALERSLAALCNPDASPGGGLAPDEAEKLKSLGYVH